MARFCAALVLFALLIACAPKADPISIEASYKRCVKGCEAYTGTLYRDGTVETPESFISNRPTRGKLVRENPEEYFEHLPYDALAACTSGYFGVPTNLDSLSLTIVMRDKRRLFCQEPASQDPKALTPQGALANFVTSVARDIQFQALATQRRNMSDAIAKGQLDSVELARTACYGSCPAYTVRFARNGDATITTVGPNYELQLVKGDPKAKLLVPCTLHARASVPFSRLRVAIVRETPWWLAPNYPLIAKDTPGATLTLTTKGERFVSKGPDAASWGEAFSAVVDRLDQIVLDTQWDPPLPERQHGPPRQGCS